MLRAEVVSVPSLRPPPPPPKKANPRNETLQTCFPLLLDMLWCTILYPDELFFMTFSCKLILQAYSHKCLINVASLKKNPHPIWQHLSPGNTVCCFHLFILTIVPYMWKVYRFIVFSQLWYMYFPSILLAQEQGPRSQAWCWEEVRRPTSWHHPVADRYGA